MNFLSAVVAPYQVYEAHCYGADAVLRIAAGLDVPQSVDLAGLRQELGLEPLAEVHTAAEIEKAFECSGRILGINDRDLHTFCTDVGTTLKLLQHIPADYLVVSESGRQDYAALARLAAHGVAAFLMGESLMRAADIGAKLAALRGA